MSFVRVEEPRGRIAVKGRAAVEDEDEIAKKEEEEGENPGLRRLGDDSYEVERQAPRSVVPGSH
jgi:hypothetical protein